MSFLRYLDNCPWEKLPLAIVRVSQVFMNGFSSPHRLDCNCNSSGILLYIREDIPSKLLSIEGDLTEAFLLKLTYPTRKNV